MFEKKKISCRPDPENPNVMHCEKFKENKDGTRETLAVTDFAFDSMCNKTPLNVEGISEDIEELDKEATKLFKCRPRNQKQD